MLNAENYIGLVCETKKSPGNTGWRALATLVARPVRRGGVGKAA